MESYVNMAKYFVLFVSLLVLGISIGSNLLFLKYKSQETRDSYEHRRKNFMEQEGLMRTGGDLKLNSKEEALNSKLMAMKLKEIQAYRDDGDGHNFPPAVNFLKSKPNIEKSEVFKFIHTMPKGAALHVHEMALTDVDWLVAELTYHPQLYMCINDDNKLSFKFADKQPPSIPGCKWELTADKRKASGNVTAFNAKLKGYMSMLTDDPSVFLNQASIWDHFLGCFSTLGGLFFSETGFRKMLSAGVQEFYEDNVQYIEMRHLLQNVTKNDGTTYPLSWLMKGYADISQEFQQKYSNFAGFTNIPSGVRGFDASTVATDMKQALELKAEFPQQVMGYDLVGQEDPGHTLHYFLDDLLAMNKNVPENLTLPFIFHAGETNWIGQDVDTNLVDALLLNTTRIGHGVALVHHPEVMQHVYKNQIPVELNPISNQILGLVSDLRNHPGAAMMAMGFPVVISSDDPGLWGTSGLSYDFYEAFMGMAGGWGDLRTLKKLAMDSIKFSMLDADRKEALMKMWQTKWDAFVDASVEKYQLKY